MLDVVVWKKHLANLARAQRRLPKEMLEELADKVKNRMQYHLIQKQTWEVLTDDMVGGKHFFGQVYLPRTIEEPVRCEAKYVIAERVDHAGKPKALAVTIRVWEDWSCKVAIEYNKAMVARVQSEEKQTFTTRMQTDVQTLAILMWLQLRGRFFWNKNQKSYSTSLYFDGVKQVLYVIQSDDFKAWLIAHTGLTDDKSDYKRLMSAINSAAMNPEISRGIEPGALFDRRGDVIYISNGDSEMAKISPSKDGSAIEMVPNGTDGVVFPQGMTLAPWELQEGGGMDPFDEETGCPPFSTANYQSEHGRMIARMWMLALPSCLRCYPAIVFTGKMRSGKSRTAKGVFELLGATVRLASIKKNGEDNFWVVINRGGVVCFDNVDTRNEWFGDAMQLACTDGSVENRTLFKDTETTTLRANAKIILTSNNPMFASESGLADRLQIVRLGQFDGKNGKVSDDSQLTISIAKNRDAVITWLARTVSKALADKDPVMPNVNMRHPDFANFAMRASRALGLYDKAILALKSAEFDKALLTIQNNSTINYVYEAMVARFTDPEKKNTPWVGRSSDMVAEIVAIHKDLEHSKYLTDTGVGKAINRYLEQLSAVFDIPAPRKSRSGAAEYTIRGFSDAYAKNIQLDEPKNESEDLDGIC